MPRVELVRESKIRKTGRALQISSLFDVQPDAGHRVEWHLDIPIEEKEWSIGLIVGPSGSGKTTIAKELFGSKVVTGFEWPADACILDAFPEAMATNAASGLLSSVGFGSVPEWLRPFHVLSTGQQFRATLARALAENDGMVVVDEFTSVVDRQVAQICSAAVAKAVRRMKRQFVAVTCHYDVEPWLDPDWVLDLGDAQRPFNWRALQGRPPIEITLVRAIPKAWNYFAPHHYLTASHPSAAHCWVGYIGDEPVVWYSAQADFLHTRFHANQWRNCRLVVLPQYQGVGIGMAVLNYICGCMSAAGRDIIGTTAHTGLLSSLPASKNWTCIRAAATVHRSKNWPHAGATTSLRPTASFRFTGPAVEEGLLGW